MNYKYNEITGEFEKAPEARKTKTKEVKTIGDYFSAILVALCFTFFVGSIVSVIIAIAIVGLRSIFHFGDVGFFIYPLVIVVLFILFIYSFCKDFRGNKISIDGT